MIINRQELLDKLKILACAFDAGSPYTPSINFVSGKLFSKGVELLASVKCDTGVSGNVVAQPLLTTLSMLATKDVEISARETALLVKAGRSKLFLDMREEENIEDLAKTRYTIELTDDIREMLNQVGKSCTNKTYNGVNGLFVRLYSDSLTAYATDGVLLIRGSCPTTVSGLKKECQDLFLSYKYLLAMLKIEAKRLEVLSNGELFCSDGTTALLGAPQVGDEDVAIYENTFAAYSEGLATAREVPSKMQRALERCLAMTKSPVKIEWKEDRLTLTAIGDGGQLKESVVLSGGISEAIATGAEFLLRYLPFSEAISISPKGILLRSKNWVAVVAITIVE